MSGELALTALRAQRGAAAHALQVDLSGSAAPNGTVAHSRWAALLAALRARRTETVLCWHADLLPLTLVFRRRALRVLFLHGVEVWRAPTALQRAALARLDLVLANSAYTLDRARHHGFVPGQVRTAVVHLGLGEPGPPVAPAPTPALVMIARLDLQERYKGHHEVIRAWPDVMRRVPEAQLWIAGEGTLRAELERMAQDGGAAGSVRFFGRISEERKIELLSQARALVMPSRAEGFGLVYLEAMRLGRPCLVSRSDAGREVVQPPECGLAVDPSDTAALTDALVRLLRESAEWQAWSDQARQRYTAHFTARAYTDRLLQALTA